MRTALALYLPRLSISQSSKPRSQTLSKLYALQSRHDYFRERARCKLGSGIFSEFMLLRMQVEDQMRHADRPRL